MNAEVAALTATAAWLGFFHTLIGPDHYVPFIAMAKVRGWTARRAAFITFLSGLGHVLGSVVLGLLGVALGIAVGKLGEFEGSRGNLAGWMLTAFGLAYTVWGLRRAWKSRRHGHSHSHADGVVHEHPHSHLHSHAHVHAAGAGRDITPWVLFAVFVFGPCEPLIPLLMYPAAVLGTGPTVLVASVFSAATVGTMLAIVLSGIRGVSLVPLPSHVLERHAHSLAGAAILACGILVTLGL